MTNLSDVQTAPSAAVLPFPDDVIEPVSGFPLVDAEAKVLARRLRKFDWSNRARIFDNFVAGSLKTLIKCGDFVSGDDDKERLSAWCLVSMAQRIGECLDIWGTAEPTEGPMAVVYNLSLNPMHRRAAREFFKDSDGLTSGMKRHTGEDYQWLFLMHRLIVLTQPGLTMAHQGGFPDDPDVTVIPRQ
jgi:hypothetical protein